MMLRSQKQVIAVALATVAIAVVGCAGVPGQKSADRGLVTMPNKMRKTDAGLKSVGIDRRARDIERSLGVE